MTTPPNEQPQDARGEHDAASLTSNDVPSSLSVLASADAALPASDDSEIIKCWCGAEGTYEQLFDDSNCAGDGECECGGDHLCVCHNHGTCPGCINCEPSDPDDDMEGCE